jgi:hypothetical protein
MQEALSAAELLSQKEEKRDAAAQWLGTDTTKTNRHFYPLHTDVVSLPQRGMHSSAWRHHLRIARGVLYVNQWLHDRVYLRGTVQVRSRSAIDPGYVRRVTFQAPTHDR